MSNVLNRVILGRPGVLDRHQALIPGPLPVVAHRRRTGGIVNLSAARMDVMRLALSAKSTDAMTILEVLEHLERPEAAAREAIRVTRRFVIASVPSKPDDNPEHIQLFTAASLTRLFLEAGAASVKMDGVLNHLIAVVKL